MFAQSPPTVSFRQLLVAHLPLIRWLAWQRYTALNAKPAALDVDDLIQDVCTLALRLSFTFEPDRDDFRKWLNKIAWRAAYSRWEGKERVAVPVCELSFGARSTASVRDVRTGAKVAVPSADVKVRRGRFVVVAVLLDEPGRVRFSDGTEAWVESERK